MGFLSGKKILITGLLSNRSIAYGIAKACHREGAELAFTYVGERFKDRIVDRAGARQPIDPWHELLPLARHPPVHLIKQFPRPARREPHDVAPARLKVQPVAQTARVGHRVAHGAAVPGVLDVTLELAHIDRAGHAGHDPLALVDVVAGDDRRLVDVN